MGDRQTGQTWPAIDESEYEGSTGDRPGADHHSSWGVAELLLELMEELEELQADGEGQPRGPKAGAPSDVGEPIEDGWEEIMAQAGVTESESTSHGGGGGTKGNRGNGHRPHPHQRPDGSYFRPSLVQPLRSPLAGQDAGAQEKNAPPPPPVTNGQSSTTTRHRRGNGAGEPLHRTRQEAAAKLGALVEAARRLERSSMKHVEEAERLREQAEGMAAEAAALRGTLRQAILVFRKLFQPA